MDKTRQSFRRCVVPSTTCSTQTSLPLPCSTLARSPGSYSDPTPTLRRLNHPADFCQAPVTAGSLNASQVSHGLSFFGHVASESPHGFLGFMSEGPPSA